LRVSSSRLSRASLLLLALLALLAFAPGARAAAARPVSVPAAGYLEWPRITVRAAPSRSARPVTTLTEFEPDFRRRVIVALDVKTNGRGEAAWYKISLPGRPNGRTGWVNAAGVSLRSVYREIVIHRAQRVLELRDRGRLLLRTKVAVGAPGMETPLGTFYVIWGFRPPNPFLGSWAFATSAYSRLSEWPGGGIVGIHGTSAPQYLGQAVSHGCVRVSNSAVLVLKRYVRQGTPIRILR
jgi:lipoprotein-anchoring transpeptidase ErfK/SrfK